VIRLIYS